MAVTRVKGLVFLSVITDEQAAVRQYTIDIKDEQADTGSLFENVFHN
jgi:hypothetical protein